VHFNSNRISPLVFERENLSLFAKIARPAPGTAARSQDDRSGRAQHTKKTKTPNGDPTLTIKRRFGNHLASICRRDSRERTPDAWNAVLSQKDQKPFFFFLIGRHQNRPQSSSTMVGDCWNRQAAPYQRHPRMPKTSVKVPSATLYAGLCGTRRAAGSGKRFAFNVGPRSP